MNMYSVARMYSVPKSGVLTTANIMVDWTVSKISFTTVDSYFSLSMFSGMPV